MYKQMGKIGIITAALLFFVVLEGALSWLTWQVYEEKKAFILERNSNIVSEVYNSTQLGYKKITRLLYDEVINRPTVIDIFKDAREDDPEVQEMVRERLFEKLSPTYERLKALNLKQLHFHLPDNTSFLRFHKPSKFGDNLTGIRYSIEVTNREKIYVEGFEEGRVYNGFRHVYPLMDIDGIHLGSVETSLSFNALRSDMEATTGNHIDFVVKRSIVEKKVWDAERDHYYPSMVSRDYLHEKLDTPKSLRETDHDKVTLSMAEEASQKMKEGAAFSLYKLGHIVVFLPVSNVAGEEGAAYLISYNKTNAINEILDSTVFLWAMSTAGVVLTSILFYLLLGKMVQINAMATFDPLTRLYNRNSLTNRLEDEMARVKRTKDTFAIIYLDVDNFKSMNDRFGHETGDRVLQKLSETLVENVRRNDAVGRWGGEEFLVCLPHTDHDEGMIVAEKLRRAVATEDFEIGERVTCSFGLTVYEEGENIDTLVSRADEYLYHAKAEGKNRVLDV
jgi:diguanylate cyclase (GGDEF)-like protein